MKYKMRKIRKIKSITNKYVFPCIMTCIKNFYGSCMGDMCHSSYAVNVVIITNFVGNWIVAYWKLLLDIRFVDDHYFDKLFTVQRYWLNMIFLILIISITVISDLICYCRFTVIDTYQYSMKNSGVIAFQLQTMVEYPRAVSFYHCSCVKKHHQQILDIHYLKYKYSIFSCT